ncbi:MAG: polysaccharide deacetylase family protein [Brevinematales bacterium]
MPVILILMLISNFLNADAQKFFSTNNEISEYVVIEKFVNFNGTNLILTREISYTNQEKAFIAINPETLETFLIRDTNFIEIDGFYFEDKPFTKIKKSFYNNSNTIGEFNKTEKLIQKNALVLLTTDLCPTDEPLDTNFYKAIAETEKNTSNKIVFIIFFSGKWIEMHKNEFDWIKTNNFNFISGNHTYSHYIIKEKFPNSELRNEIIKTELIMLKNGLIPSCFFRFPGLKYNPENLAILYEMNLLPLSVNFWGGQKSYPQKSILLVHSNGSVPIEVKKFIKFLKEIKTKNIKFVPPEKWFKS